MIDLIRQKIQETPNAKRQLSAWRFLGQKIVFTNGCFDLIHPGHMQYLAEARALGHRLVIGLNSDASTKRLKGKNRPIVNQDARALLLASFSFVDLIVIFEEDTPLNLISALDVDILVKGGDYKVEDVVGAKEVIARGGVIKTLSFLPGYSTSDLEAKIKGEPAG